MGKKKRQSAMLEQPKQPQDNIQASYESIFTSVVVNLQVKDRTKIYRVHRDVFLGSSKLSAIIDIALAKGSSVVLDITAPLLGLILPFLYGISTTDWTTRIAQLGQDSFHYACEVYCFALEYNLVKLKGVVAEYISNTSEADYRLILSAAMFVYDNVKCVEPWFRLLISHKTQEALLNTDLADVSWFTDTFLHGHNGLSKELFGCYRKAHQLLRRDVDTPCSETYCDVQLIQGSNMHAADQPSSTDCWHVVDACLDAVSAEDVVEPAERIAGTVVESRRLEELAGDLSIKVLDNGCTVCEVYNDEAPVDEPAFERTADEGSLVYEPILDNASVKEAIPEENNREMVVNLCKRRSEHLLNPIRWTNCQDCMMEVKSLAEMALRQ